MLAILLLPSVLIHYAYASITPTATTTLIPPYAAGPATYYASLLHADSITNKYVITCVAPSSTTEGADPCRTSTFGTKPVTFYQGPDQYLVVRSTFDHSFDITDCSAFSRGPSTTSTFLKTKTCAALPTPMLCEVLDDGPTAGDGVRENVDMCDLGLAEQEVLMVETLPTADPTSGSDVASRTSTQGPVETSSAPGSASFSDIAESASTGALSRR